MDEELETDAETSEDEAGSNGTDYQEFEEESDNNPDLEANPLTWSPHSIGMRQLPFTKREGLRVPIPGNRPIDFFFLLLDVEFLQGIVQKTNAYALELFCEPNITPKSRITNWKDITVEELKIFLGLLIDMGLNRKPNVQDYWQKTKTFSPVYGKFMGRDRFLLILRCLNCNSHDASNGLSKVRYCIDYFNNKINEVFYPQKNLTLDEGMVFWRGRLYFHQHIRTRRHKYGIKLYTLCDPRGLILKCLVNCGALDDVGGTGHAENVVLNLMQEKLNSGHSLYMNDYYSSVPLAAKLLSSGTYCTSTLDKKRRYQPEDVKYAHLENGCTIARYSEGIMVAKWKGKRVVSYLSTEHVNDMVTALNERKIENTKPLPIVKYNALMKGADRSDQMQLYYPLERMRLRWYKKVFFHFIHMTMMNSYYLFNEAFLYDRPKKMPLLQFTLSIVDSLLPDLPNPVRPLARPAGHTVSKIERKKPNSNRISPKRCRQCTAQGKLKYTTFECVLCPEKPGLCPGECFDKYHCAT